MFGTIETSQQKQFELCCLSEEWTVIILGAHLGASLGAASPQRLTRITVVILRYEVVFVEHRPGLVSFCFIR